VLRPRLGSNGRGHREIDNAFRAPRCVLVLDDRQLLPELTGETRLLLDLAERAGLVGLARFGFPLREGPVVVLRPVNQQDLGAAARSGPRDDAAGGADYFSR